MDNSLRAQVLIHALPFIQKYTDKIVVVKYGGNAMVNEELKKAVMNDVVLLSLVGIRVVLVHGGGPEISDTLKQMDIPSKFAGGLRVTDRWCWPARSIKIWSICCSVPEEKRWDCPASTAI